MSLKWSNIIYCISCSKSCQLCIGETKGETGRRLSDRFAEHLRSVRNNDVDKPVARHFETVNHSISDIKVCAILPISGGNNNRKRQEKRLIFKIWTIHPHRLNERFSFIWSLHSFCFCPARADKSGDLSPFRSIVYDFMSTLKIANDLPIFVSIMHYYAFVIVSLTWLAYFLSHDYLFYIIHSDFFIYFLFLSDEGPTLETLVRLYYPYRPYTLRFSY